jgi:OOP family OmpA-OmpF porin
LGGNSTELLTETDLGLMNRVIAVRLKRRRDSKMRRLQLCGAFVAVGFLAGCVGSDIEAMRGVEGTGSDFTRALTEEYRQITLFEADDMYDWIDAGHFARKGLRAAGGEVVEPEPIDAWDLPADKVGELTDARGRLVSLLDATARSKVPQDSAHAQGRFDCWIEQQEENHQPAHIAACRDAFYEALAKIEEAMKPAEPEPPAAAPTPFVLFFDFDSSTIDSDGQAVIDSAIAMANNLGVTEFSVTGHTDRAGPEEYNLGLSLRRAGAVKAALEAHGIDGNDISVAGRGEAENAVPTADGVRERANRRVEIIIQ